MEKHGGGPAILAVSREEAAPAETKDGDGRGQDQGKDVGDLDGTNGSLGPSWHAGPPGPLKFAQLSR